MEDRYTVKKFLIALLVILLVLGLAAAGYFGYTWYRENHIFVEDAVYPISSESLDLREQDISIEHYNAVHTQLPNCQILWNVPFQGSKYSNDTEALTVSTLTQEDVELLLTYFPKLNKLDATKCSDYGMLELYKAQKPDCEVLYTVSLGKKSFAPDTAELVLENGDYDYDTMLENLIFLPEVSAIQLKMPQLTAEQIDGLKAAYEKITVTCTVELMGREYGTETTALDLSAITPEEVQTVAEKLVWLPNLTEIELMNAEGVSQLTKQDVKLLMAAAPQATVHYVFDFYGDTLTTADEQVHVKLKKIGDEGADEIRAALDLLPNCKRFVLEYCQVSNEMMAKIRDEYRDRTKVVWRVQFGRGSALTDAQVIRAVYDLVDDNCEDLIYCEDVRFMDIGHNEFLDGVPFVAGMPKLEGIIVSGAPIKSLEPFANCKNLKFLEIAFCEYIDDLSPLAGCEKLEMLNISNTHALDLSPLDELPLTHFCARLNPSGKSRIPTEEQERFIEKHPDCWTSFSGAQPYGVGWRYDEDELTPLPYYAMLREVFRYAKDPNIPNHVGWYLEEE